MFVYDLFAPTSQGGVIFRLQKCSSISYSPFRWDPVSQAWIGGEIPMDRFMQLPGATPAELSAAGLRPIDLTER